MKKSKMFMTVLAVLASVVLAVPQNTLSVSAEEKKPIGKLVCQCGHTMEIYTYGMSDDEAATWDAHMMEHLMKGEEASYTDVAYDNSSNSNGTNNGTSGGNNGSQTGSGTNGNTSGSNNGSQAGSGTNSSSGGGNGTQTGSGTNSGTSGGSNGTQTGSGTNGSTSDSSDKDQTGSSASGVLSGTGDAGDNAAYGVRQLTVLPTNFKTISLSWSAVPGAKSYEIYYSTSPNGGFKRLANVKKTSYKFSKAECGKTYYFQMRVCEKTTKSSFGPISYAKTSLTGTPAVQVKKTTYNSVALKWSKVTGAKRYQIYYRSSTGDGWQLLTTVGGISYTHKRLVTGASYSYKVRPVRDSFYGVWSNEVSATTELGDIVGLKVKATGSGQLNLTWKKVKGATQYVILRADRREGTYQVIGQSGKSSYADTGLESGKTYYYKVYAVSGPYKTKETGPVGQTVKAARKS